MTSHAEDAPTASAEKREAGSGDTAAAQTNVVDFEAAKSEKVVAEAERLAGLAAADWLFQLSGRSKLFGVDRGVLEKMVKAIVKEREQQQREAQAEGRRQDQRVERQQGADQRKREREQRQILKDAERKEQAKSKALIAIAKLPSALHEAKLAELAKQLDEEVSILRDEFAEFVGTVDGSAAAPADDWYVEPWPEPVETAALLPEIITKISKHLMARPHEVLVMALWVAMAWVHEIAATHSAYLVATSAEENSGKTTALGVVRKPSRGKQLLAAFRDIFATGCREITSAAVTERLNADPTAMWCEFNHGGPITQRQVAGVLDPFEIHPVPLHPTRRKDFARRGYKLEQFIDVFERFMPGDPIIRSSAMAPKRKRKAARTSGDDQMIGSEVVS